MTTNPDHAVLGVTENTIILRVWVGDSVVDEELPLPRKADQEDIDAVVAKRVAEFGAGAKPAADASVAAAVYVPTLEELADRLTALEEKVN